MITHLVLFKFKPGITLQDMRVQSWIEQMNDLPKHIPGITGWQHGPNVTKDDEAYDYALASRFENEGTLQIYFEHPVHRACMLQGDELMTLCFVDLRH